MKLVGDYRFQLPRKTVWEALLDAEVLSRCLPGFERLEKVGDNDFEGSLDLRVGPVQGKFRGRLSLSNLEPPVGYDMAMKGQGPAGFISGTGSLSLAEDGESTLLGYDLDTQVGGKIAGVGQRLLESSAKALSEQALGELGRIVQGRSDGGENRADGNPIPEGPSQADFAARVAKEVAKDLVPPERRALLVTAGLVVVVIVIVFLFRSCGP